MATARHVPTRVIARSHGNRDLTGSSTFPRGPGSRGAGSRAPPSGEDTVGAASAPARPEPPPRSQTQSRPRRVWHRSGDP